MSEIIKIDRLGHLGDGISESASGPVFIPFSLPGETISVNGTSPRRELQTIIDPSPFRNEPFCQHFGECGGCQMQHMEHGAYLEWKVSILNDVLARAGIDNAPSPILHFPIASRRRVVMHALKTTSGILLGFSQKSSNQIIGIKQCPIMIDGMIETLPAIRTLSHIFAPRKGNMRVSLLACDNGFDLSFTVSGNVSEKDMRAVSSHKLAGQFIRININGEVVLEAKRPVIKVGSAFATPPPDAFVQASAEAEIAIADLVTAHLADCKKVVDLFSGFGTFSLRLAENSVVYAAEMDGPALAALDRAWRETGGKLKAVTHEKRDLYRRPLNVKDLKNTDGVVFDPPRAGAEEQCIELAKSKVRKIAAVSCDPQTLARDLKILIEGGFKIISITPIDQFAFTPHLETVALLER